MLAQETLLYYFWNYLYFEKYNLISFYFVPIKKNFPVVKKVGLAIVAEIKSCVIQHCFWSMFSRLKNDFSRICGKSTRFHLAKIHKEIFMYML